MKPLVLEPTATAQWHALVNEAAQRCDCRLDETLESYLVFLLMRFTGRPEVTASVLALEFLQGAHASGRARREQLQEVGDKCLLFSGLFPRRADRCLVRVGYFVALGRTAYHELAASLARGAAETYTRLSEGFVTLMDVLQAMRGMTGNPALTQLAAVELWHDTASRGALRQLQGYTDATPVADPSGRRH